MAPTGIFNSHLIMAACVERHGTEEQKQRYLPRFATGELRGGIGLTEPDAGTDLQGIRSVARRDGDDYVINGTKTWITNGVYGTCFAVLVKTDPEAEPRHKGMSMFIAEKGHGFTVGRKIRRSSATRRSTAPNWCSSNFRVRADQLVGRRRGPRLPARGRRPGARPHQRGRARRRSRHRRAQGLRSPTRSSGETFGKPIAEHQAIQLKLADMATRVEAARLLVEQAARKYDTGERCDLEAGMAKLFASEAAVENSLEAMRIFGGYSYSIDFDVERYYRDAPLMCIGEGTNEMQRIIIARSSVERNPV